MSWITEELSTIDLGDSRLNRRAINLLDDLSSDPVASLPKCCQGWSNTKAAYRFFDNKKVNQASVLAPHQQSCLARINQEKRVLLLQDTTELNYSGQKAKEHAGPSHYDNEKIVFFHPTMAITPDKRCLGITDIYTWYRRELQRNKADAKKRQTLRLHHQSISEKESYRWLLGYRSASAIAKQCADTHVVMVADREADISDIYDEAEQMTGKKADWLVRCKVVNRTLLTDSGERDPVLLKEKLTKTQPVGRIQFELPRKPGKKSRVIEQSIRVLRVKMHPPTGRRGRLKLRPFWVTALLATEDNPPNGEKAIEWLLLTSITLTEEIQFHDILNWYLCRWQIEIFFYILKSGCRVEALQLTTEDRFLPCLAMYSIIAWRILMMTQLARTHPEINCEVVFKRQEWNIIYQITYLKTPPTDPPALHLMIIALAKMGGFLDRKSDGFPGPKTIWLGLKQLHGAMIAIDNYKTIYNETYG